MATRDTGRDIVFYDGGCGLCHAGVTFLVKRDRRHAFDYAPLHGETFGRIVPPASRGSLPDSVVIATRDGALLVKSDATLHALRALGGAWSALGRALAVVPRSLRDAAYDLVARVRRRLAAPPSGACPLVPAGLRDRFLP